MKVNITSYLTISSLSYKFWISYLHSINEKLEKNKKIKIEIEIPDKNKYDFIKKSVYGGRCNAIKKEYVSSAKVDNYEEFINSNDFIFNADVSSLYPTAMAGFEHVHVKYPIGLVGGAISQKKNLKIIDMDFMKFIIYHQQILIIPFYLLD